jgi:hypothetical protein
MKSRKILLSTEGPGHNVLKFKPPMVFNQRDAQHFLAELEQVLGESPLLQNVEFKCQKENVFLFLSMAVTGKCW